MPEVSLSLLPSGSNAATLTACAGHFQVKWRLTDGQLALLAAQAVSILNDRAQAGVCEAAALADKIVDALNGRATK